MARRLTDEQRREPRRPGSTTAPAGTTVRQVASDAVRRIGSRRTGVEQARHFFQAATTFVERAEPAAIEAIATSLDRAAAGVAYSAHDIETVRAATAVLDAFRWRRSGAGRSIASSRSRVPSASADRMVTIPLPPPVRRPDPIHVTLPAGQCLVRIFDPTSHRATATSFRTHGPALRFDHQRGAPGGYSTMV